MQFTTFLGACECVWLLYHGWIVYACVVVYGLDGLSPLGVSDVLVVGHMMGMELVEFPSATNGRGVLSMVIACVGRTMGKEL